MPNLDMVISWHCGRTDHKIIAKRVGATGRKVVLNAYARILKRGDDGITHRRRLVHGTIRGAVIKEGTPNCRAKVGKTTATAFAERLDYRHASRN